MKRFPIYQWGSWMNESRVPIPILYVKPDNELLDYFEQSDYNINVTIENTKSPYDNTSFSAVVGTSKDIPNYRPNFFKKTGLYVIVLDAPFVVYPEMLKGNILLNPIKSLSDPKNKIDSISSRGQNNMKLSEIILVCLILFLIFLFCFYFLMRERKEKNN